MNSFHNYILLHQAYFREAINGSLMIVLAVLTCLVAVSIYQAWDTNTDGDWPHTPGVPTACALFWVFAMETYRTGAIWHIYHYSPSHDTTAIGTFADVTFWPTLGYIVAGSVLVIALLRCVRIFSPPWFSQETWILTLISSIAFLLIVH